MSVYLTVLIDHGLSEPILETLRSHGIATTADLQDAMAERRLKTIFDQDERIEILKAVWKLIMSPRTRESR